MTRSASSDEARAFSEDPGLRHRTNVRPRSAGWPWPCSAAGLVLRLFYIWHYRIDSDEPQHLHVVWGWTRGLLPYRDVFDNHSPLFQALYAPLFQLFGVRADILLPMRAAELPLFALTIYAVWRIAGALYSARTALWTAVLTAVLPWFYLSAIEFRPDQLWALLWLLLLMVLTTGRVTPRRVWLAGLLCGAAFSVSMKTTLLLMALAPALAGALLVRRAAGGLALRWAHLWRCAAVGLTGVPIIPGIVVLFFYLKGAAREMYYCVIRHNILPGSTSHGLSNGTIKCCLLGLGVAIAGGFLIARLHRPIQTRTRIAFVYFAGIFYLTALFAFWPLQPAEDYLPFFPTMMLSIGPGAAVAGQPCRAQRALHRSRCWPERKPLPSSSWPRRSRITRQTRLVWWPIP